jgi:hypothetical protein
MIPPLSPPTTWGGPRGALLLLLPWQIFWGKLWGELIHQFPPALPAPATPSTQEVDCCPQESFSLKWLKSFFAYHLWLVPRGLAVSTSTTMSATKRAPSRLTSIVPDVKSWLFRALISTCSWRRTIFPTAHCLLTDLARHVIPAGIRILQANYYGDSPNLDWMPAPPDTSSFGLSHDSSSRRSLLSSQPLLSSRTSSSSQIRARGNRGGCRYCQPDPEGIGFTQAPHHRSVPDAVFMGLFMRGSVTSQGGIHDYP